MRARMLGRIGRRRFTCDCCDWSRDTKTMRSVEKRAFHKEVGRSGEAP